jgi:hypothetical protein
MSMWMKISYFFLSMMGIVSVYITFRIIKALYIKYQANKDRNYNVFDKAELTSAEKSNLKKWKF